MLNAKELELHTELLQVCSSWKRSTQAIVITLLAVARRKLYRKLRRRNLVEYIVEDLKIDSTFTFDLNRVVRAALEYPELEAALRNDRLTVSKATRNLSVISVGNAKSLIDYAATHTYAETNTFVAEGQPKQNCREGWKQLSADQYKVSVVLTAKQFEALRRVQSLEAQKQKTSKMADAINASIDQYITRNDPVEKAHRSTRRKARSSTRRTTKSSARRKAQNSTGRAAQKLSVTFSEEVSVSATVSAQNSRSKSKIATSSKSDAVESTSSIHDHSVVQTTKRFSRKRFTAADVHQVNLKTGSQCCFIGRDGKRCDCDRWLAIHHIVPVSMGGTNDIDNLIHLCWAHHDLVHQYVLPLDDETTWWTFNV